MPWCDEYHEPELAVKLGPFEIYHNYDDSGDMMSYWFQFKSGPHDTWKSFDVRETGYRESRLVPPEDHLASVIVELFQSGESVEHHLERVGAKLWEGSG